MSKLAHALQKLLPLASPADTCKWHLALHLVGAAAILIISLRFLTFLARVALTPSGVNWKKLVKSADKGKKTPSANWAAISGASDGIGKEFALQLAKKGFNILLIGRNPQKLTAVQKEISTKSEIFVLDYANPEAGIFEDLEAVAKKLSITVLVNNAGVSHDMPTCLVDETRANIDQIIQVNCLSTVQVTRSILPSMIRNARGGLILNMGSVSAELKTPMLQVYAGSKAFLRTWSESLAAEIAEHKIHVELLNTHFVATNMSKIRRSSWTCPTPRDYVRSVLARCGNGFFSTLFPGHAIVFAALKAIPDFIMRPMVLKQMKATRRRALAKASKSK